MASNPQLRHHPERLRAAASRVAHGPVRAPLRASPGSIAGFPRPFASSRLAKLGRERATAHAVFPTGGMDSPQGPHASVGGAPCTIQAGVA